MSKKDVQAIAEKLGIDLKNANGKLKTVKELNADIDSKQAKAEEKPVVEKPVGKVEIKTASPQPNRKMIENIEYYYQGFFTKKMAARKQVKHIERTEKRTALIEEEQGQFFHVWKTYKEYKR